MFATAHAAAGRCTIASIGSHQSRQSWAVKLLSNGRTKLCGHSSIHGQMGTGLMKTLQTKLRRKTQTTAVKAKIAKRVRRAKRKMRGAIVPAALHLTKQRFLPLAFP